jgi:outer membrane immunogenic protein
MKSALLAAVVVAALTAGTASAQSAWDGFYVGGHVGAAFRGDEDAQTIAFDQRLNGEFSSGVTTAAGSNAFSPGFCSGRPNGASASLGCRDDADEFEFGLRGGYDRQFGAVVVGGVLELNGTKIEDNVTAFSTTPANYTMSRRVDSLLAARLRVGYAFDRYLGYVTAGGVKAKVDYDFATSNGVNTFVERGGEDRPNGWQAGAGLEAEIAPRVRLGLEYVYTRLEDDDSYRVRAQGPAPATNPFVLLASGTDFRADQGDFDFDSVRVTLSVRF